MVRLKLLFSVLLYAMLTLGIFVIVIDVLLAFSFITTSSSKFWPLELYKSLVIPEMVHLPPSQQLVRMEPSAPRKEAGVASNHPQQEVLFHSPLALSAEKAANATFIFHVCPGAGAGVLMELLQRVRVTRPGQIAHIEEMSRLSFPPVREWSHWHRVRNLLITAIDKSSKPCVIVVESPAFLTVNAPDTYYFSLLYDPLRRLQNHYLLDHWGDDLSNYMHPNWLNKKPTPSFERCVQSQGRDCSYANARYFYTLWFCGFDRNPNCVRKGKAKEAAALSRRTIKDAFMAVGVMEELRKFLIVLEMLVPTVFVGLEGAYRSEEFGRFVPKRNMTLSPEVEGKIRFTLTEDYQLFNYTKDLFLEKFEQLKASSNSSLGRR